MKNVNSRDTETRFADLRLDNDLKQKDVAKILNVLENNYSKWERGITDIPLDKSNELANYYNCSLDYLFGLSEYNTKKVRKEINLKLLCERLYKLRKDHNLSQEQLSSVIGFHQRTYSHYEDGSRVPTSFKVYYIALYYKVSLDYLVGKSDDKSVG